ncbi:hypothetical protein BIU98_02690 [Curtobacterium sp. MMLR14_010]|uniref:hypothetical protein n=1 Tax=Curtobacterium sp. MMLR14_010 TaxID=1898743 RepID=UPI0008DD9E7A|nr:hypothetical protein [Curtobacterium sp. MMLR14_010]OII34881.1 hypothetical protein BIU98_02690 [Curtobacterium sp. MMLR14_010]
MSALDRLLIAAAVAASPPEQRAARHEQWLADVRDAHELDLSPTALALGALTTVLFHRRAGHRSTWGDTMTTMPGTVRSTPHTIPTIPVLLTLAVVSFLAGSVGLGLVQRYNGLAGIVPAFLLISIVLTVVPGLAVAASVLLVTGAPIRRRATGALVVLAVTALWWSIQTGFFNPPVHPALSLGIITGAWLAVWLVVLRRPGWTWSLLLLPVLASVLVFPLSTGVYGTQLAFSLKAAVSSATALVPFLAALLAATIAGRLSTDAPAGPVQRPDALAGSSA